MADAVVFRPVADGSQCLPNANIQYSFVTAECVSNTTVEQASEASLTRPASTTDSSQVHCTQPQPLLFDADDFEQSHWTQSTIETSQQRPGLQNLDQDQQDNMPCAHSSPTIKSEVSEKSVGYFVSNILRLDDINLVDIWALIGGQIAHKYRANFEQSNELHLKVRNLEAEKETLRLNEADLESQVQALQTDNKNKTLSEAKLTSQITDLRDSNSKQKKLLEESQSCCKDLESSMSRWERRYGLEKDQRIELDGKMHEQQEKLAQMTSSGEEQDAKIESMAKEIQRLQEASDSSERKRKAAEKKTDDQEKVYKLELKKIEMREDEAKTTHKRDAHDRLTQTLAANQAARDSEQLSAFSLKALCDSKGRTFSLVDVIGVLKELQFDEDLTNIFRSRHKQYLGWVDTNSTTRVYTSKRPHGSQQTQGGGKRHKGSNDNLETTAG